MKRIRLCAEYYLRDARGSINTNLGADLFLTLLLVFLISTALLLKTSQDNTDSTKSTEEEMRTPNIEISLPENSRGGLLAGRAGATKVSARLTAEGDVEFFVDSEKITLDGIAELVKQKGKKRVELRLEDDLTNALTVKIIGQLQLADVKTIYYVFIKK